MYAIIVDCKVIYLGEDRDKALHIYSMAVENDKCFAEVSSLEQLEGMMGKYCDHEYCGRRAKWVRETQFAGKHFFCAEHAELEKHNEEEHWKQLWD